MAVRRWHQLLTSGRYVPAVGNSDTHRHSQTIGLPQTVVHAEDLSVESLVGGYRRGNSWIAESSVDRARLHRHAPTTSADSAATTCQPTPASQSTCTCR